MDHNFVLCVIYDTDVCLRGKDPGFITLTNLLEPWMSTPICIRIAASTRRFTVTITLRHIHIWSPRVRLLSGTGS